MASFSKLPNEMVSQVWSNILEPENVESFALVSKHVYAIGKPFVEEHNRLKKEYSYSETALDARAPALLLEEVLLRPRVALYVTHLSIGRHVDDEWPIHGQIPCPDDVMALFVEVIQRTGFVPLNEISNWITKLEEGNEDPILALLFMFLPNLTMVILMDAGYEGELFLETIQRIAEVEKTLFLKRLTEVVIQSQPGEGSLDLNCFKAFASLPLVQSIHFDSSGAVEDDNVINDTQYLEPSHYNITELTFTYSGIRPKTLFKILESINRLYKIQLRGPR